MTGPGRNDPCPCGSGKKFKKCCLGKDPLPAPSPAGPSPSPDSAPLLPFPAPPVPKPSWDFTLGERDTAIEKLLRFSCRTEFNEDCALAFALFGGPFLEEDEAAALEALQSDMSQINLQSWFLFDLPVREGAPLAEIFLRRRGYSLSPGERAYIHKGLAAHFRLYEILAVRPEEGFLLKDLFAGGTVEVHERRATRSLHQWEVAAMRLMDYGGGHWTIDAGIIPFHPDQKRPLLQLLKALRKEDPSCSEAVFFKRATIAFQYQWLDTFLHPPRPEIRTPEGDPVLLTKVRFSVTDPEALRRALDGPEDISPVGKASWTWTEAHPEGGLRNLGSLALRKNRLTLDVLSSQRGKRGRRRLEALAGPFLRHEGTVSQDPYEALDARPHKEPTPQEKKKKAEAVLPEWKVKILKEHKDRHYSAWPDTPLPIFGGKTPRQTAAHPRSRPKVVELLKSMEVDEARRTDPDTPAYDFRWLWKELGLDRDKEMQR